MRSSKTRPAGTLELLDRSFGGHASLVEHDDVVAGEFDVGQQVRREDQVHALVVGEVANELEHLVATLRVHSVGRLVEEQQIGVVHERLGELDALLHAGRVGLEIAVARLAEADVIEHLVGALHRIDVRQAGELAAIRHEGHGIHAGDVPVDLRHVADARADLLGRAGDVKAQHSHRAGGRRNEAEQRLDHRALAGAVGPQQPDRAQRKLRRDVHERAVLAVLDGHRIERDGRIGGGRLGGTGLERRVGWGGSLGHLRVSRGCSLGFTTRRFDQEPHRWLARDGGRSSYRLIRTGPRLGSDAQPARGRLARPAPAA